MFQKMPQIHTYHQKAYMLDRAPMNIHEKNFTTRAKHKTQIIENWMETSRKWLTLAFTKIACIITTMRSLGYVGRYIKFVIELPSSVCAWARARIAFAPIFISFSLTFGCCCLFGEWMSSCGMCMFFVEKNNSTKNYSKCKCNHLRWSCRFSFAPYAILSVCVRVCVFALATLRFWCTDFEFDKFANGKRMQPAKNRFNFTLLRVVFRNSVCFFHSTCRCH